MNGGGILIWNEARDRGLAKWNKGEREHGGDLHKKPVLDEAIDEAIDQVSYLLVLRRQTDLALAHLDEFLATGHPEDVQKAGKILRFGNPEGD